MKYNLFTDPHLCLALPSNPMCTTTYSCIFLTLLTHILLFFYKHHIFHSFIDFQSLSLQFSSIGMWLRSITLDYVVKNYSLEFNTKAKVVVFLTPSLKIDLNFHTHTACNRNTLFVTYFVSLHKIHSKLAQPKA